jgi:hypothetical protein
VCWRLAATQRPRSGQADCWATCCPARSLCGRRLRGPGGACAPQASTTPPLGPLTSCWGAASQGMSCGQLLHASSCGLPNPAAAADELHGEKLMVSCKTCSDVPRSSAHGDCIVHGVTSVRWVWWLPRCWVCWLPRRVRSPREAAGWRAMQPGAPLQARRVAASHLGGCASCRVRLPCVHALVGPCGWCLKACSGVLTPSDWASGGSREAPARLGVSAACTSRTSLCSGVAQPCRLASCSQGHNYAPCGPLRAAQASRALLCYCCTTGSCHHPLSQQQESNPRAPLWSKHRGG